MLIKSISGSRPSTCTGCTCSCSATSDWYLCSLKLHRGPLCFACLSPTRCLLRSRRPARSRRHAMPSNSTRVLALIVFSAALVQVSSADCASAPLSCCGDFVLQTNLPSAFVLQTNASCICPADKCFLQENVRQTDVRCARYPRLNLV